jgi:short-subunit dehydrogenase
MSAPGIPEFAWQSADQVAEAGWAGWQQNRAVVVPGALNKATVGMVRVLPRVAVRKMAKRVADTL